MSKPISLPRWANSGGEIVEPSSGKKDIGWVNAELPPHSYFNWYQNLVYQWTVWLDGLTDEALTWTAAHIFQKGITVTQSTVNGNAITATGNGTGKGVVATGGGSNGTGVDGTGGAGNGIGVNGLGTGTEAGVKGTASGTAGSVGVRAVGSSDEAVKATTGSGTKAAVSGTGSFLGVIGVGADAAGGSTGRGVEGYGGNGVGGNLSGGVGVYGKGGTKNGSGADGDAILGEGVGSAPGVHGTHPAGTGPAMYGQGKGSTRTNVLGGEGGFAERGDFAGGVFLGVDTDGDGGYGAIIAGEAASNPPKRASLKIGAQQNVPANGTIGDLCVSLSHNGRVLCHNGGGFQLVGGALCTRSGGTITLNNSATPTFTGQNVASVAIASSVVTVTFTTALAIVPVVSVALGDELTTTVYFARVNSRGTTTVSFKLRDTAGVLIDPAVTGSGLTIDFLAQVK